MLDVSDIQTISEARAKRWHGEEDWSALEWAGALCGEAGEAANAAKKLKRLEVGMMNIDKRAMSTEDEDQLKAHIAKEAADTILYAFLLISKVGKSAEMTIRQVFNQKSQEYGFPERL